jgi:hypothetical protein
MDIWHTADPEQRAHTGWLGRVLDGEQDPLCETHLGTSTPLALTGSQAVAPSVASLEGFELRIQGPLRSLWEEGLSRPRQGEAEAVRQAFLRLKATLAQVGRAREVKNRVGYPSHPFGQALADVARMVAADLPTRVFYVSLGSFDTHADQPTGTRTSWTCWRRGSPPSTRRCASWDGSGTSWSWVSPSSGGGWRKTPPTARTTAKPASCSPWDRSEGASWARSPTSRTWTKET